MLPGLRLDYSCDFGMAGSEFDVNNMKAWLHSALYQWFRPHILMLLKRLLWVRTVTLSLNTGSSNTRKLSLKTSARADCCSTHCPSSHSSPSLIFDSTDVVNIEPFWWMCCTELNCSVLGAPQHQGQKKLINNLSIREQKQESHCCFAPPLRYLHLLFVCCYKTLDLQPSCIALRSYFHH